MKKLFISLFTLILFSLGVQAQEQSTVCANHILVPTMIDAVKLKTQIKSFEDFQYYAQKYSECPSGRQGGSLGCFGKGQMVKSFEDAAFNGNTDEVIGPVRTQFGYHLIWVTKKY